MKFSVADRQGKVSVEVRGGKNYRLRWYYGGTRYCLTIGSSSDGTAFNVAQAKAQEINGDILMERFDSTLAKYSQKHAIEQEEKQREPTLRDIWQKYQRANAKRVAKTTQKGFWKTTTLAIARLSAVGGSGGLEHPDRLLADLLDYHKSSTVRRILTDINAACNWAVRKEIIAKNPYIGLVRELPKEQQSSRSRAAFEPDEVKAIVKAFESQKYGTYGYYVGFLALTGFRPEEAIALTWDDLKQNEKGSYIRVNKAHSKGELKATKTYDSRLFPCNVQLSEFISKIPKISNKNNLVFPSNRKDYIDQHNFLSRYWHPVVWELFDRGEISQYLPCYNLRHSFITRLVRDGIDPATVAKLAGNSPEIIMKHYLSARNDVVLPEL